MNGDEMDGVCGKNGGEKTYVYNFGLRNEGWNSLEDLVFDGKIIFKMDVKDDSTACAGLISLRK